MPKQTTKRELVYPDLSYKIIGCAFEVFNEIGSGHKEAYYQKALSISLQNNNLKIKEQVYSPLKFKGHLVGKNFFDFVVENKIVVEIKAGKRFSKAHYEQVLNYLKISELKLALLINFGTQEVRCKRVINFDTVKEQFANS